MDQFTILNGKKNKLIHLECYSRNFNYVNADFNDFQIPEKIYLTSLNYDTGLKSSAKDKKTIIVEAKGNKIW